MRVFLAENPAAGLQHGGEGLQPPLQAAHHRRLQSVSLICFTVLTSFPNLLQCFPQCSWPVCLFSASCKHAVKALCGVGCASSAICFYERQQRQRGIMGWMVLRPRLSCRFSFVTFISFLLCFSSLRCGEEQPAAPLR